MHYPPIQFLRFWILSNEKTARSQNYNVKYYIKYPTRYLCSILHRSCCIGFGNPIVRRNPKNSNVTRCWTQFSFQWSFVTTLHRVRQFECQSKFSFLVFDITLLVAEPNQSWSETATRICGLFGVILPWIFENNFCWIFFRCSDERALNRSLSLTQFEALPIFSVSGSCYWWLLRI